MIQTRPPQNPQKAPPDPEHLVAWEQRKNQIMVTLPKFVRPERFERMLRTAYFEGASYLSKCSPVSFINSVSAAAEMGLEIGKTLGHAYLVPFKGQVTLIIGYRGFIFLASRAGILKTAEAHAVYRGEQFQYYMQNGVWQTMHNPTGAPSKKDADITHVYGILKLVNGGDKFEAMERSQIEEIRHKAPSGNSPAWLNTWGEMAKKTVLRRMFKTVPVDAEAELMKALRFEDEQDYPTLTAPKPEIYAGALMEAEQISVEAREVVEKNSAHAIIVKYIEIAEKRGINLQAVTGRTHLELSELAEGPEAHGLLLKIEEALKE